MKILVLCTGNSCRSQMAEGWLRSWDKKMTVVSAGTEPAERVSGMAVEVMAEAGVDIGEARPKNVREYISESWDFVVTVCGEAAERCPTFEGKVDCRIHIGVDDPAKAEGTEEFVRSEFRRIREELRRRLAEFYVRDVQGRDGLRCECNKARI